jgi:hypothetical protein
MDRNLRIVVKREYADFARSQGLIVGNLYPVVAMDEEGYYVKNQDSEVVVPFSHCETRRVGLNESKALFG